MADTSPTLTSSDIIGSNLPPPTDTSQIDLGVGYPDDDDHNNTTTTKPTEPDENNPEDTTGNLVVETTLTPTLSPQDTDPSAASVANDEIAPNGTTTTTTMTVTTDTTNDTATDLTQDADDGGDGGGEGKRKPRKELTPEELEARKARDAELIKMILTKVPQPDDKLLEKRIQEQKARIDKAIQTMQGSKDIQGKRVRAREESKPDLDKAYQALHEQIEIVKQKIETKKALNAEIKALKDADMAAKPADKLEDVADGKAQYLKGIKSVQDVENRIKELEYKQATESLTLQDEKKLVNELSFLRHKGTRAVQEVETKRNTDKQNKEARKVKRDDLEIKRKDLDTEINEVQLRIDQHKKTIEQLKKVQDEKYEELKKEMDSIDYDALKKDIADAKAEIKRLRDVNHKEYQEWKEYEKLRKEKEWALKRIKYEKINAEREQRRLEREKELAQLVPPDPYEAEKDMCDNLIAYLNSLAGLNPQSTSATRNSLLPQTETFSVSLTESKPAREIAMVGKQIGKNKKDEDVEDKYAGFGKGKTKANKGKKQQTADSAATTSQSIIPDLQEAKLPPHSVEKFLAFQKLGLEAPLTKKDIPQAIENIKEKRKYYDTAPPPPPPETTKPAAPRDHKDSKDKKKKITPDLNSDAFESLTENPPKPVVVNDSDSAKPSFSDIIRGKQIAEVNLTDNFIENFPVVEEAQ